MTALPPLKVGWLDRALLAVAPQWGLKRLQARAAALEVRHFEAATTGRLTDDWFRSASDPNAAVGPSMSRLRQHARELKRNNAWARRGLSVWANHVVGRGLVPVAVGVDGDEAARLGKIWRRWAESTACDLHGRRTFRGLQRLAFDCTAESGEVLAVKRVVGEALKVELMEPDYLDHAIHGKGMGRNGRMVVYGVEFDERGRRTGYRIFNEHPGSSTGLIPVSEWVDADDVLHMFWGERPGQVRAVTWLAPVIFKLKDHEGWHHSEMMRRWTASQWAAIIVEPDGVGDPALAASTKKIEKLGPGTIEHAPPGKDVRFPVPPADVGAETYVKINLRSIAAGIGPGGITYEDQTGDYSQVNYSSARMGRLQHWQSVEAVREHMLVPLFCDPWWRWVMEAAQRVGEIDEVPAVRWIGQPMPLIDPPQEFAAYRLAVRSTLVSLPDAQRELGNDPEEVETENAAAFERLERLGLVSDSNPKQTNQQGALQIQPGARPAFGAPSGPPPIPSDA